MKKKIVYLMRGLPACGKSHKATRLAEPNGCVLETDQYFFQMVGSDSDHYDYSEELLPAARQWNLNRFYEAISEGVSPIVVDRGNGLNRETKQYAAFAVKHGYDVVLAEPDSPWWQELRVLLKYKAYIKGDLLDYWARKLSETTRGGHRVPESTIRRWMDHWRSDVTVEMILAVDGGDSE
ncbi:MAG: ATP-binding protein [Planctomycetales bacterium]|nr:ATP-binding protein [Planctomycetales bacterium]